MLLVQMQTEDVIKVEMFPGATSQPQFTPAARIYRR